MIGHSRLQHSIRPGMSMDDCLTLLVEAKAVLQATERMLPKTKHEGAEMQLGVFTVEKPPSPPDHREADDALSGDKCKDCGMELIFSCRSIGDGLCHPCAHRRHADAEQKATAARREVLRLARENITLQRQVDDLRELLANEGEGVASEVIRAERLRKCRRMESQNDRTSSH